MPKALTLQDKLIAWRAASEALVLAAAVERNGLRYATHYADGQWQIEVDPNGMVHAGGYAEEVHGGVRSIAQLSSWEIGGLLDTLEDALGTANR